MRLASKAMRRGQAGQATPFEAVQTTWMFARQGVFGIVYEYTNCTWNNKTKHVAFSAGSGKESNKSK